MAGMPWPLPWPFERTYMQLALVAALAVGLAAPLIGTFLVQKRLSLLGDGLGHVAVAGVGAGILFGASPTWAALIAAVAAALSIEWLRARDRATSDLALALVFYGGIAGGVVLASRSATNANLEPYLFGSVLTVDAGEVGVVVALSLSIAATVLFTRRALFAIVLDEEAAIVSGVPVRTLNAALAVLTAVTIVAAMRVVGVLLIAALMVLPVATSRLFARSFATTLAGASIAGVASVVAGLVASRAWALAPGGAIVLTAAAIFAAASIAGGARRAAARSRDLLGGR